MLTNIFPKPLFAQRNVFLLIFFNILNCKDIPKIVEIIHEAPQRTAQRADNFQPVINHAVRGGTLMAGLGKVIARNRIKCSI